MGGENNKMTSSGSVTVTACSSPGLTFCADSNFSIHFTPTLPQYHGWDPGHPARSAGGTLQLDTYILDPSKSEWADNAGNPSGKQAHRQLITESSSSLLSLLTHCGLILDLKRCNWCACVDLCLTHSLPRNEALVPCGCAHIVRRTRASFRKLYFYVFENTAELKLVSKGTAFWWRERTLPHPTALLFWCSNQQKYDGWSKKY